MKFRKTIGFIFLFSVIFIGGFFLGRTYAPSYSSYLEGEDATIFWKTWWTVENKYFERDTLNKAEMISGAAAGMVESLDNPYTIFLKPEEAKRFLEEAKGSFEGVGLEIAIKDNQLQVIAPLEGTPAQKAGMRPGDKILKVDGRSTANVPLDTTVSWIRGAKDTEVVLTVYREEWGKEKDIKLIRKVVDIPSLKLELWEDGIAYLKLYHFSEKADTDFKDAVINILKSSTEKIILDLRNNPGGYLDVAQNIAGWFLEKGELVVIENFGEDEDRVELYANGNPRLANYPLVVLINSGSASGSEILAGALRDNRDIKLIGEASFGKGSVQELIHLKDGYFLKLTVAEWLTPKGYSIGDQGLLPDIVVEYSEADYEADRDPQLDKAIEIINNL